MFRHSLSIGLTTLALFCASSGLAAVAELPTAGLATTSLIVGAAGVVGGGWFTRLASYGLGIVDPPSGTFYSGTIVIDYPENLLAVSGVGWFGNFAVDPTVPAPPVSTTPFFDVSSSPYNFNQSPNSGLTVSTTNSGGVLTLSFNAPNGISVDSGTEFNLLAVTFQNISGSDLAWNVVGPHGQANFFDNAAQQTLTCRPDPTFPTPVTCGENTPANRYFVTPVPEPRSLPVLMLALAGCWVRGRARGRNGLLNWFRGQS
jgi:hypothetical protein